MLHLALQGLCATLFFLLLLRPSSCLHIPAFSAFLFHARNNVRPHAFPFPPSEFRARMFPIPQSLVSDLVSCMAQFSLEEETCCLPRKKQRQTPRFPFSAFRVPCSYVPHSPESGVRPCFLHGSILSGRRLAIFHARNNVRPHAFPFPPSEFRARMFPVPHSSPPLRHHGKGSII
jgi:hypothetical protein